MTEKSKLKSLEKALSKADSEEARFFYLSYLFECEKVKGTEAKLQFLEKSLAKSKSTDLRIIYVSYFGPMVDHVGDGFIDGEE